MAVSIPILLFHTLEEKRSVISFSPGLFQRGMQRLYRKGYRTLTLCQAAAYIHRGHPFPERSLVLTFDDGFQTIYEEAFPILEQLGMAATVFLTVGRSGPLRATDRLPSHEGRPMLNWAQIREMQSCGISFGAHTLTHPDLTRLHPNRAEVEIRDSKAIIEDVLGHRVDCFAYPYGRYNLRVHDIARQHFSYACAVELKLISMQSDLYALERVDAFYLQPDPFFSLITSRLFPWYIRLRNIARRILPLILGRAV